MIYLLQHIVHLLPKKIYYSSIEILNDFFPLCSLGLQVLFDPCMIKKITKNNYNTYYLTEFEVKRAINF